MSLVKKYLNNVTALQFLQLFRYSTLILIGIVFAKTALTQSEIGEYETFVFLAGAVSFFWLNGLIKAFLPLSAESEDTSNFFSAFAVIQLLALVAALFVLVFQSFFARFLLNGNSIPSVTLLATFLVVGVPANLVEYYYLVKKKNSSILIYAGIVFPLQFILVVLPVLLGYGIRIALYGLVLSALFRYIWLWYLLLKNREVHFSAKFMMAHLKLGTPLVAATLFSGSAQFIDGFIVTSQFDEASFALFRYGARELPLAMLLANALSNAMLPTFGKKEALNDSVDQLKSNVKSLMHLLFPLSAFFLLVSKPLFPVIFNPDFAESATIFNIYLLLLISRLLLPQTILNGLKLTKPIMVASIIELVVNVGLSLWWVNIWGIAGIAAATFFAYLLEKVFLMLVLKQKLNISVSRYIPVRIYLFYSIGIVVLFIFTELIFS